MGNLGLTILRSFERACPIDINGAVKKVAKAKFSLSNPYILEAIPESRLKELSIFEGKKLNTVCRVIDDKNYPQMLSAFKKMISKGFSELEIKNLFKKAFPYGKVPSDANIDAKVYLSSLPSKVGMKYDAHGMTKGSIPEQLKQLNELLSKGVDKNKNFFTAPLAVPAEIASGAGAGLGTAGGCAYRDGSFILLGEKGKMIENSGIKSVIVNDVYYPIIKDLQKKFPDINFMRADKATEILTKI